MKHKTKENHIKTPKKKDPVYDGGIKIRLPSSCREDLETLGKLFNQKTYSKTLIHIINIIIDKYKI